MQEVKYNLQAISWPIYWLYLKLSWKPSLVSFNFENKIWFSDCVSNLQLNLGFHAVWVNCDWRNCFYYTVLSFQAVLMPPHVQSVWSGSKQQNLTVSGARRLKGRNCLWKAKIVKSEPTKKMFHLKRIQSQRLTVQTIFVFIVHGCVTSQTYGRVKKWIASIH